MDALADRSMPAYMNSSVPASILQGFTIDKRMITQRLRSTT